MKYLIFISLMYTVTAFADVQNISLSSANYKEAAAAQQYLRFDMKSTKAGLITTSFTGFVKKANVSFQDEANAFSNVTVSFNSEDMDTDVDGRNEKMWGKCLDSKKHPQIVVRIAKIEKNKTPQTIPAVIQLLGHEHTFQIQVSKVDEKVIEGTAVLGLKELGIPDPSIFIASVKNEVSVSFHFEREK